MTTSFAFDIVDIIAAFIHVDLAPSADKKNPAKGPAKQPTVGDYSCLFFSYLLAASPSCLHFFPSVNLLMKSRSPWKQKARTL